ncbi:MAG: hypothetical protein H6741_26075 [Alphaproteobacteria bacterium]|nr:hypothetical protein [Alphaproteobacteria bacterium]
MRVALLENLQENAPHRPGEPSDAWAELGSRESVQEMVRALERQGYEVAFFEGGLNLLEQLPAFQPDLCFNLCEGHVGEARECHVPALLEMMGIPHTGAGITALALTLDKALTHSLLAAQGLPVPPHQVMHAPDQALAPNLRFPLFVKPVREGSSKGISLQSLVWDEAALRRQVRRVLTDYQQPALVERFIRGREVTVGLLGNASGLDAPYEGLDALPAFEILFDGDVDGVYVYEIKSAIPYGWERGQNWDCPAPLPAPLSEELARLAKAAFVHTRCRDYARVDFRLDVEDGLRPYILEVNALPGLAWGWSDIAFEAAAAGLTAETFLSSIVEHAARRLGLRDEMRAAR